MSGKIFLITGQSGVGKYKLAQLIKERWLPDAVHIEGRDLRDVTSLKGFSGIGRVHNMKNAMLIASFLSQKNIPVIISMVAPYRSLREIFKDENEVIEVYLKSYENKEHHFKSYEKPCDDFIEIKVDDKNPMYILNELERKLKKRL